MPTSCAVSKVISIFDPRDRLLEAAEIADLHTDFKDAQHAVKMRYVLLGFVTLTQGYHELT